MSKEREISGTAGSGGILCPFYIAQGSTDIICEGTVPETTCTQRFKYKTDKQRQQESFCEGCFKRCEHYIAVMHFKYWDEE